MSTLFSELGNWGVARPEEAARWLSSATVPWWVAGGWALDLFVGRQTREHGDLDIGVLRRDSTQLLATLHNWEIFEAHNGVLARLSPGAAPRNEVNSLWCRPVGSVSWVMEILLDASEGGFWLFRRQTQIRRPLTEIIHRTAHAIPYLAPEIQLLYKARSPRPRDTDDFANVSSRLDPAAKKWLRESLRMVDPAHLWLAALDGQN